MSLESQVTRVSTGAKDTLKTLMNKLGGHVSDEPIDQYPALADALEAPQKITGPRVKVLAKDQIQIGNVVYTVDDLSYEGDLQAEPRPLTLDDLVSTAAFSPDGSLLVLGGDFTGCAKLHSVTGTTITYLSDIYADTATTALDNSVMTAAFSPDGSLLVLGGYFTGKAKLYAVSGTTISYLTDLYADAGATALDHAVDAAAFSPDGSLLVLGGSFTGKAKLYAVSSSAVSYLTDICADAGTTVFSAPVSAVAFSPDGSRLVLGGSFTGWAKLYAVSSATVSYLTDLYADVDATALGQTVETAAFSPDGSLLVLGGNFTNYAKLYFVSGSAVSYLTDIHADPSAAALNRIVSTAVFSPDGALLALGGSFTGRAKLYAVSGATVSYLTDLYADGDTLPLNNYVITIVFALNGNALLVGGNFTGYAKVFSYQNLAYAAQGLLLSNGFYKFGIADTDMRIGDSGMVTQLASFRNAT